MSQHSSRRISHARYREFSRRAFLGGAVGLLGSTLLAACEVDQLQGGSDATPTPRGGPEPTPAVREVAGYDDPSRWEGHTLVVATPMGEYREAQAAAIFEPFERLTGATIEVERVDLEELRQQVNTAEVTWSVCDVPAENVLSLANAGVIQEIDYTVVDEEPLFAPLVLPHGTGSSIYATVMAYRQDFWENTSPPETWQDFWALGEYPGNRGLPRDPAPTLEFALLADGVPMNQLYPLDVDRAFEMLDMIREPIVLWWEQGAQASQMLQSADLAMVGAWHNRIQRISTDENPIHIRWEGAALNGRCWAIPSGAPNSAIAMDFINFATRAEVCAVFSSLHPFGPVNLQAFDLLPAERVAILPGNPALLDDQFTLDYQWWFRNREETQTRFEEWLTAVEP